MLEAHRIITKHNLKVQIVDKNSEKSSSNGSDKDTDEKNSDEFQSSEDQQSNNSPREQAHSEPIIEAEDSDHQSEAVRSEKIDLKRPKLQLPEPEPQPE